MMLFALVVLLVLNLLCAVGNYRAKRYAGACFNSFATGFMAFAVMVSIAAH